MSYNKHGEYKLCKWVTERNTYFIRCDRASNHVLQEGSSDGKELFSTVRDDGKKEYEKGRGSLLEDNKLMYDIKQLQSVLGIGRNLAYKLAKKRGFPSVKINGHYYFPRDKVEEWVDKNTGRSIIA